MSSFFERTFKVLMDEALGPQARSKLLADTAKTVLKETIDAGDAPDRYRKWIDGHEGAAEETVRPDGRIEYQFDILGTIAKEALDFLIDRSPQRSSAPIYGRKQGKVAHFRDAFYVGVDGRFVPAEDFNPEKVPATAEIVIGNQNAYSRKVDVQLVGGKTMSFAGTKPFMFDDCVSFIKGKYGTIVEVKRVYSMKFPGQYELAKEQSYGSGPRKGRPRGRKGEPVESPALIISPMR